MAIEKGLGGSSNATKPPHLQELEGTKKPSETKEQQTLRELSEDISDKIVLTYDNGRWVLRDKDRNEIFGFINEAGDYILGTIEEIRANYLKEFKSKGGLEAFRKKLFDSGYLSEAEYKSKDPTSFNVAITDLARDVASNLYNSYESNAGWSTSLSTFLTTRAYGREKEPTATRVKTTRQEANDDINDFFMEMLGRRATDAERQAYFNKLSDAEKKATRKTVVKGGVAEITDTLLDEADIFNIKAEILAPSVRGTELEKITSGGGKIAQSISTLKKYASDYGINLTTSEALNRVVGQFKKGALKDLSQQEEQIKEMSKAFYGNIANLIDKGVKVSDIAGQFANYKARLLDISEDTISVFDEDIQRAIKNISPDGTTRGEGVMSIGDYETMVRKDPILGKQWAKTTAAKEQAVTYTNAILKMFGLVG